MALFFSFNYCLKSVTKPNNSLHVSRSSLVKRSCPAIRNWSVRRQPGIRSCGGVQEVGQLECKPVFEEEDLPTPNGDNENWVCLENASDILRSRIKAYHDKLSHQDTLASNSGVGNFYKDFAAYLNDVWMEKALANKYYSKALARERSNAELLIDYAEFVWKRLDNITMAAELLEDALLLPDFAENVHVLGMYSYILWHTED